MDAVAKVARENVYESWIDERITNIFSNYNGDDSISVPAMASTTRAEAVRLVLEKCKRKEEPFCY